MGNRKAPTPAPAVTKRGLVDMQVCVPEQWDGDQVVEFANRQNPSGTQTEYSVRTDPKLLGGDPARNPCSDRADFVHIMLDWIPAP